MFDCSEKKQLFTKFDRDLEKNSSLLPRVLEATVACYDRDGSISAMCKILVYNVILVLVYNLILVFM